MPIPKKTSRISETVLHDEEDDISITNSQSSETRSTIIQSVHQQNEIGTEQTLSMASVATISTEAESIDKNLSRMMLEPKEKESCTFMSTPSVELLKSTECLITSIHVDEQSNSTLFMSIDDTSIESTPGTIAGDQTPTPFAKTIETTNMLNLTSDLNVKSTISSSKEIIVSTSLSELYEAAGMNVECEVEEATSSSANEKEGSNIFDVTFDTESVNVNNSNDGTPALSSFRADGNSQLNNIMEVKELFNVPMLEKTNLRGMKELLNSPSDRPNYTTEMLELLKETENNELEVYHVYYRFCSYFITN